MRQGTIFIACVVLIIAALLDPAVAEMGIIRVEDLNMRSGPSTDDPSIKSLGQGTRLTILERKDGWIKVSHLGQTGYIRDKAQYVRILNSDDDSRVARKQYTDADDKKESFDREIAASRKELKAISKAEAAVLTSFSDVDQALNQARLKVSATEKELKKIDADIRAAKKDFAILEDQIKESELYASERLVALYKLQWMGKLPVLATADSILDFFDRKNSLERILRKDEELLGVLAVDLQRLSDLLETLNQRRTEKAAIDKKLKERLAVMDGKRRERKDILNEIQNKKSLQLAALQDLEKSAKALNSTMDTFMETKVNPAVPRDLSHKQFPELKGLLIIPVEGKITNVFGQYKNTQLNVVNFRSGITIRADRGEPIRAVYGGITLYSDWFKGYGNMIIIDHGDHYYTVYAHLEEQFKSKGDPVEAGEVIATVGDTGSMNGPNLHFEVRHHGKPEDPLKWIKKG